MVERFFIIKLGKCVDDSRCFTVLFQHFPGVTGSYKAWLCYPFFVSNHNLPKKIGDVLKLTEKCVL